MAWHWGERNVSEEQFVKVSFGEAFSFFLRGLAPALVIACAAATVAFLLSRDPVPLYRSTAILLATRPASSYSTSTNTIEPSQVDPDIYRSAVVQGGLLENALTVVQGREPSPDEVASWRKRLKVRVDEGLISGLVRIEVDDHDPALAASVANGVADALLTWDRGRVSQNVQATIASLDRSLVVLAAQVAVAEQSGDGQTAQVLRATREQRLAQLRSAEALSLSAVVLGLLEPFRAATADVSPVNDRTVFLTAVAFALGFLITYIVLFFLRITDPRVRGAADLERIGTTERLAVIPSEQRRPAFVEAIGRLCTSLPAPGQGPDSGGQEVTAPGRVIVVTSPTDSSERGYLARHLAVAYSRVGWAVLLVDADLRDGVLTASLPTSKHVPALDALLRVGDQRDAGTLLNNSEFEFNFIHAGAVPIEGATVLLGRRISQLINSWRTRYDVIVIDSTALATSASALTMASEADAIVLVVRKFRTRLADLQEAAKDLVRAGAVSIGTVLMTSAARRLRRSEPGRRTREVIDTASEVPNRARATVVQRTRTGS